MKFYIWDDTAFRAACQAQVYSYILEEALVMKDENFPWEDNTVLFLSKQLLGNAREMPMFNEGNCVSIV